MNFIAPPNWPQPPAGWTPPPGWSPDPAWGPAPEGWQFWADDDDADVAAADPATRPMPAASSDRLPDSGPRDDDGSGRGLGPALSGAWSRARRPFTRRAEPGGETAEDTVPSGAGPRSRTSRRVAAAVAAVALFAGGIGIGAAASDPTASDEYVSLASDKSDVDADYVSLQEDYDEMSSGLEERHSELQEREDEVSAAEKALGEREGKVEEAEAAVKKREEAVSGAERKKAENTIREGTWTVGVDIAPGTYRSTSDVGSRCYWAILATGTNGDDIITNDIPGGGRPSVTIAEGQDFETKRCGTWDLQ
ncbi:hypothetical protein ACH9EU_06265 [Kocuria sp. M1R5S2]|uniref:hypothetical protein n=1 Tax=Kocuria rhizosphaerae TaxID=3376285 RepID=UPI0037B42EA6